jgi:tetratricopeptide (TPR) repeat protein
MSDGPKRYHFRSAKRRSKTCAFVITGIVAFTCHSARAQKNSPPTGADLTKLTRQVEELEKAGKYSEAIALATKLEELYEKTDGATHPSTVASLGKLGELCTKFADYTRAEPLLRRALETSEKVLGPEHPDTARTLNKLGNLYANMGDYAKAEPILQRAIKIEEKTLGPDDPDTASSVSELGELYQGTGDYAKAESLFERALKVREARLGPNDRATAESLNDLGMLYLITHNVKAESLLKRALNIEQKALGPDHPDLAFIVINLAQFYSDKADYTNAEPLLLRALKIREKALVPEHRYTAVSLSNLAWLYESTGSYAKAESLYQHALKIDEQALGPNHPGTAVDVSDLALLYWRMGDYAKAEPLDQRALRIKEKVFGPEHVETAISLNNLATLYKDMGDYAKVEPLLQRAIKILEKVLGAEHPDTARDLNNLGLLYRETGDYAKAEPLYQRALEIYKKTLGPEHPDTASGLNNLAALYEDMGDYAKAELLCTEALDIRQKALGPEHPDTASSLNNLAQLYRKNGDYAKAEPLYQRALKIDEKALGHDRPATAIDLNNLALLYDNKGDYMTAEPLYQQSLEIKEKALGPDHPSTATALNNLAALYGRMGEYAKAKPLYERALKIYQKALGPEHPLTANNLKNLGLLYVNLKQPREALLLATQARVVQEKNLSHILSFTSEQQRLAFQKITDPYDLAGTLGSASELAEIVLRQKGVVLDSLLEDRLVAEASLDPKQREVVEKLRSAKQRLTKLLMEIPKDLSEQSRQKRDAEKEKLSTEVEQLEGGLARQVTRLGHARRALSVTVQQVQSALPKKAALIELLRYSHYLGRNNHALRYGAIVFGTVGEPTWVPLGSAVEIEKQVALYQKSVRGQTDEATLGTVLRALAEEVWAPIEKALPAGTATVVVSPDAELNFVSFATLLTVDDRFVGEKYSVRYVASGRDLLREAKPTSGPKTTLRLFANPDFGKASELQHVDEKNALALRSIEMHDLSSISFPSLPGTEKESAELKTRASKSGWQSQVYIGANATEAELRKVNSPRILHLTTHGFFLPEIDFGKLGASSQRGQEIPKGKLVNPMHRSGLAMAGAQTTLQAWGRGEVPPTENDGIVTAEEVGGLKLDGTWLVVLSACDTGGGEAKAGEGVMGLRRGFIQAGAQNLLMTLWPISDETTVQIMLDFYDAALKTGDAPQALADTERDWLVKLRKERGLLAAVSLAGPFIMSSQGKQ